MKPLAIAAAFVGGTLAGFGFAADLPLAALAMFAASALLGALLLAMLRLPALPALAALAALLGAARVIVSGADALPPSLADAYPQEVVGVVASDVRDLGGYSRFRLRLERARPLNRDEWTDANPDAPALIQVTARPPAAIARQRQPPYFRYGDRLQVAGRIQAPPPLSDFDYAAYLARQGVGGVMYAQRIELVDEGGGSPFYRHLYALRHRLAASAAAVIPQPEAALAQAMLLGVRDNIPPELRDAFRRSGAANLLAISGLHIGILLTAAMGATVALFGRRYYLYLLAPLAAIWLYALLSGMSPSAARACIMGSAYLAAIAAGRRHNTLAALGIAAALMVAASPNVIFSISFQLSFAAMAGIAALGDGCRAALRDLLAQRAPARLGLRPALAALADIVGVSVAVGVAAAPLVAYHFEQVSLVGVPAMLLTLPALPIFLVSGALAAAIGLASETIALPFGWLAWGTGAYIIAAVELMASLPRAAVSVGGLPIWALVGYYIALTALALPAIAFPRGLRELARRIGLRPRDNHDDDVEYSTARAGVSVWLIAPAAFAAALVWADALSADDRLRIHFIDVGQGDAAFIETPGGVQALIDGGAHPLAINRFLSDRMRFNDKRIDLVVATHPHADHIGGLTPVLARYEVGHVLERRVQYDSAAYLEWRRAVDAEAAEGAVVLEAMSGQALLLGDGIRLEILGPPPALLVGTASDADNASVVLRLEYGDVSALFTGDMRGEAERALLASGALVDSDVLKVAHHGSATGTTRAFLRAVSPAAAVISVGEDNRFGHPAPEVMQRLREYVSADMLLLTSERGDIEFITDGKRLELRTER